MASTIPSNSLWDEAEALVVELEQAARLPCLVDVATVAQVGPSVTR